MDADSGVIACDPGEIPVNGIFVSATAPDGGVGSAALPFKTLSAGLDALGGKLVVYVDEGTYPEVISLDPSKSGVTISGGWQRTGGSWKRDCDKDARKKTVIASPAQAGLKVGAIGGTVRIRTLSIFSKPQCGSAPNQSGESCYGVVFVGPGTLNLEDVEVTAGEAGNGGAATTYVAAVPPNCGNGVSGCSDGGQGNNGDPAHAAMAGVFTATGYSGGDGHPGEPGSAGANGTPGGSGQTASCYLQGCSGGGGPCAGHFCGTLGTSSVTSGHGLCGCGGAGGPAGGAGRGGGASIGIFASGSGSIVNLSNSAIQAGKGGNGSAGRQGESGSQGKSGSGGLAAKCYGNCESVDKGSGQCNCEQPGTYNLAGGTPGGTGGPGGAGTSGSGGAGGPSWALVRFGGSVVSRGPDSTLVFSTGGTGFNLNGPAGEELIVP